MSYKTVEDFLNKKIWSMIPCDSKIVDAYVCGVSDSLVAVGFLNENQGKKIKEEFCTLDISEFTGDAVIRNKRV